jgi:hypothetical protein
METVTLTSKRRQNVTQFVHYMYAINNRIFFLSDSSFLGGHLRFGQMHFPRADMFYGGFGGGGFLRIESSCIQVNTVSVVSYHGIYTWNTIPHFQSSSPFRTPFIYQTCKAFERTCLHFFLAKTDTQALVYELPPWVVHLQCAKLNKCT